MVNNTILSLKIKSTVLLFTILTYFSKTYKIEAIFPENVDKNNANPSNIHEYLNHGNWSQKTKIKKSFQFHILRWTGFF